MEKTLGEYKDLSLEEAERFLKDLLPQAGKIIRRHFEKGGWGQTEKVGVDFTTQADCETDEFLQEEISKNFTNHQFLTEETAPDYSNPEILKDRKNQEFLWVIDPLDGTGNFSTHDAHFAISVALVSHGQPILATTYAPMFDELYTARTYSNIATCNGEPISVSQNDNLKKAMVRVDWSWDLKKRPAMAEIITKLSDKVRFVLIKGSAALDLSRLARGDFDAYIHMGLKPWDVAAASLIVEKAGGVITTPDDKSWDIFTPEIFASNPAIRPKILEILNQGAS